MFDKKLIKHLAELGKIAFDDKELEKMSFQMADIMRLMDKVKEFSASDEVLRAEATAYADLRRDEENVSYAADKITENAKAVKDNSFVVPKVV